MAQTATQKNLYDRDFVAWCDDTVAKLKARQLDALDFDGLIEEIASLAARDRRELESRLRVLLAHLLKRLYLNSSDDYRGWENTIDEQRSQLELLLKYSPSLRNHFVAVFDDAWWYALKQVRQNYPQTQFPDRWEFSCEVEAILTEAFWQFN